MQILLTNLSEKVKQSYGNPLDSMQLFSQFILLTSFLNEFMDLLHFHITICLKALGIMEYEVTAWKSDLIFNIVVALLSKVDSYILDP